jgi:type II secretory pathway component PulM
MSLRDSIDSIGDSARSFLAGLTARDRTLLGVMVLAITLAVGWFVVGSMEKSRKNLKSQVASGAQAQAQVNLLMARYAELAGDVAGLDARLEQGKGFSPASWLEQSGNTMGISESIKSIQERGVERHDYYQAQKVELVLDDIDLVKLVELLHTLQEAPQAMRINDVRVKTDRKVRSNLDIRMEIAVLKPLDDA